MRRVLAPLALLALVMALAGCGGESPPAAPLADVAQARSPAPPLRLSGAEPRVVWAIGDGGTGDRRARSVVERAIRGGADRILYLGDVYERGTAAEFARNFAPVFRGVLRRTAPTPGNHEWGNRRTGYGPFWRRVRGRRVPAWYAFTVAGWRILSLNSEAGHGRGSDQLQWLERELTRPDGTCRIAFWHRPRLSAGKHGDQRDVAPLWDALRGRARLVLGGHDHNLQRMRPVDGIVQLVSGAGGRERYQVDEDDPRLAFSDDRSFGGLRMVLRPGRADLAFVEAGGRVLDRSAVACARG